MAERRRPPTGWVEHWGALEPTREPLGPLSTPRPPSDTSEGPLGAQRGSQRAAWWPLPARVTLATLALLASVTAVASMALTHPLPAIIAGNLATLASFASYEIGRRHP